MNIKIAIFFIYFSLSLAAPVSNFCGLFRNCFGVNGKLSSGLAAIPATSIDPPPSLHPSPALNQNNQDRSDHSTCPICFNEYSQADPQIELRCSHKMHIDCYLRYIHEGNEGCIMNCHKNAEFWNAQPQRSGDAIAPSPEVYWSEDKINELLMRGIHDNNISAISKALANRPSSNLIDLYLEDPNLSPDIRELLQQSLIRGH